MEAARGWRGRWRNKELPVGTDKDENILEMRCSNGIQLTLTNHTTEMAVPMDDATF